VTWRELNKRFRQPASEFLNVHCVFVHKRLYIKTLSLVSHVICRYFLSLGLGLARTPHKWLWLAGVAMMAGLAACGTQPVARTDGHLQEPTRTAAAEDPRTARIPPVVRQVPLPPPPKPRTEEVKYSVVVENEEVRSVLFAIARDTQINIDIHPGIEGRVSLNAIEQTLKQILTRMARQVDMRWESQGDTLVVMPDTPFLRNYRVDYVNVARDVSSQVAVTTQIVGAASGTSTAANAPQQGSTQNNSTLALRGESRNRFWETLERNLRDLLRETDKLLPEGSSESFVSDRSQRQSTATTPERNTPRRVTGTTRSPTTAPAGTAEATGESQSVTESRTLTFREAAYVIVNPESGVISVRATSRQHEKVSEFLEQVTGAARRQVLIEATVVEVLLSDRYQSGVDWSALAKEGLGYTIRQNFIGANLAESPFFSISYANPNAAAGGSIGSTVKLLNTFGTTRVLQSPKLMVLNNQTAVMKVVDNVVYFTVRADTTTNQTTSTTTFTTTQNVVPIGLVMNVTPQISDEDVVLLNVRPSVSRVIGYVNDPNPALATARVTSRVPEIQTREMESVLRVGSGQTAVLGGLMLDSFETNRDGLPIVSRIPVLGDAASYRNDVGRKSELVVFMRPIVIREASVDADLKAYRPYLPDREFFRDTSPSVTLPAPVAPALVQPSRSGSTP
jgi:MSHA biogenesis protein MshL